jgi:hypothetical protein
MMTVNGEKVWVPANKRDLIAGLKRMGIYKVAGVCLSRLTVEELTTAYCRERARIVRHRQAEARRRASETTYESEVYQLKLLPN